MPNMTTQALHGRHVSNYLWIYFGIPVGFMVYDSMLTTMQMPCAISFQSSNTLTAMHLFSTTDQHYYRGPVSSSVAPRCMT